MSSSEKRNLPWTESLIEALGLATFMISACAFGVLLFHPDSPVVITLPDAFVRRVLMGVAMGVTAVGLINSAWGRRSGAHFNPAVTLTFFRLGKVARRDLVAYIVAQFTGGLLGVFLASKILGEGLAHPSVRYVVTQPGPWGSVAAFLGEAVLAFALFSVVVRLANHPRWMRHTGVVAGGLIALFITLEAPVSGMSLNPARSLGSAWPAGEWRGLWIYFMAPPLGMLAAAEVFIRRAPHRAFCAKLLHDPAYPCIFCNNLLSRSARPNPSLAIERKAS